MDLPVPDWLSESFGDGPPPRLRWSFTTDGPLVDFAIARETGEVLAGDETGGVYRLDRRGRVAGVSRGFRRLEGLAWNDTGERGAAVLSAESVCTFNRRLEIEWRMTLQDAVSALALDPRGNYLAVALRDRRNAIYSADRKRIGRFTTLRPLRKIEFVLTTPELIGAAESGLLVRHRLDGEELWTETGWSNIGDLCTTSDGSRILVAAYTHGVRIVDGDGQSAGAFLIEGTPARIASTASGQRLAAATVERYLYWMQADGSLLWTALLPEDVVRLACDPLGRWLICGLAGGRIFRLEWDE